MKFKKYIFDIIFILFIIITFFIGFIKFDKWAKNAIVERNNYIKICESYYNNYPSNDHKIYCEKLIKNKNSQISFFEAMEYVDEFTPFSSNFILILFVVVCTNYYVCRFMKNNVIKNYLIRENYAKIIKKIIKRSWLSALILPFFMFMKIILYYIYTGNFNFDIGMTMWTENTLSKPILFLTVYLLIAIFDCIIYSNIGLIVSRKKHNYIISVIVSYITIIGIELFLEVIISGLICPLIFNNDIGIVFNIINFGHFSDAYGLFLPLIISLFFALLSSIILLIIYRSKEKLVIDCESNN